MRPTPELDKLLNGEDFDLPQALKEQEIAIEDTKEMNREDKDIFAYLDELGSIIEQAKATFGLE